MKAKLAIILFTIFLPMIVSGQPDPASQYIGYEYEGVLLGKILPNGVTSLGGALIGDIDADPVYEIAEVKKGKTKMLWFNASTGKNASGVTGWKVLDVLSFSSLARTRYVFFAGDPSIGCRRKGTQGYLENIVGDGKIVRARGVFIPSNLWLANLKTKKFERISLAGITCEYSEP